MGSKLAQVHAHPLPPYLQEQSMLKKLTNLLDAATEKISLNQVLFSIVLIFAISILAAVAVTILNATTYARLYSPCLSIECLKEFPRAFSVQIRIIKFGVSFSSFVAVIFGSFLALRSYLTAAEIGAFGNRISHIGLFERFILTELARRRRLTPSHIDVYSLYRLMFPNENSNSKIASSAFVEALSAVYSTMSRSSATYDATSTFYFESHRRSMITALSGICISMDSHPRRDFLEVEEEVLGFLSVLSAVFAPSAFEGLKAERNYK